MATAVHSQGGLEAFIARLPKAELHLHIEGSLEPELIFTLAQRNGISLPYPDVGAARAARETFTGLQDFLNLYYEGMDVLRTEQDFYDLTDAYLARAASEGVRHSEIMFDPQAHLKRGIAFSVFFPGLLRAVQDAPARHGVTAGLIMCFMRDLGAASAAEVLQMALPFREHLLGVGLDSAEKGFPPSLFTEVFEEAGRHGLRRMAHAGEEGGPENIQSVVQDLKVDRIDHGVRCLDDPQLVAALEEKGIALTVCPLSNLCLKVYEGELEAKLKQLCSTKLAITVNSDDPAYFLHSPSGAGGTYINANFLFLARCAGLAPRQLAEIAAQGFRSSFLDPTAKRKHEEAVWAALAEWEAAASASASA